MVKNIVQIGTPVLVQTAKAVKDAGDPQIVALVKDLLDTCNVNVDGTAGLSAPQIGVSLRVCVVRRTDIEDKEETELPQAKLWEVLINPEIIKQSARQSYYWEGCLSIGVGENALFGPVLRSDIVKIKYINRKGEKLELAAKGYFAHIIQHEIDHLNGVLFLKYIDNPQNIWKNIDLDAYIQKFHKYPPILDK